LFGILQRKTLNQDEQQCLLNLARKTIASRLAMQPSPPLSAAPPRLRQNRGVFVTLNKDGNLRGCIGVVHGVKPLYQAMQGFAIAHLRAGHDQFAAHHGRGIGNAPGIDVKHGDNR